MHEPSRPLWNLEGHLQNVALPFFGISHTAKPYFLFAGKYFFSTDATTT
jgi:hypothetical protein